ncbi:MAG: TolC family protein [Candidatus Kryptoniota bacterium]
MRITGIFIIPFFALVLSAPAQPVNEPRKMTLQECISIAARQNANVLQAEFQAETQDAKLLSAYGNFLPSLSASGQFSRQDNTFQTQVFIQGIPISTSGRNIANNYSGGLSASYTFFDGFANIGNLNLARKGSEAYSFNYKRARQSAIYQATQLYLTVLQDRELMKVSEDNLKRDQRQLEKIKTSYSVGSASIADVYSQETAVSNDKFQLVQAQNNYENAQANLKFFLGLNVAEKIDFVDPTLASEIDTTEFARVNQQFSRVAELLEKAYESRPDYIASRLNVEASEAQKTVAKAMYYPTVSGFAQYNLSGTQINQVDQNKRFYLGLSISLPIFNGFQTQSQIDQANVAVKSAQQNLDVVRRQVQLDVYQALLNLHAAENQYEAALNGVQSAKLSQQTAEEKYNIGSGTLLDLLTANAQYTIALSNRVQAAYAYINAKKAVEFALGIINQ